jgi:hypothetical protein
MINELFERLKKPAPNINDCFYLMYKYDANRDGKLDV